MRDSNSNLNPFCSDSEEARAKPVLKAPFHPFRMELPWPETGAIVRPALRPASARER